MMSNANSPRSKSLTFGLTVVALAACSTPVFAQSAPSVHVGRIEITGVPDDWSHRHVVFSNPGTEQEAIQSGHYAQWQKVVNDPRYVIQQLKRNLPVQGPAATDAEYRSRWISEISPAPRDLTLTLPGVRREPSGIDRIEPMVKRTSATQPIKKDWSEALNGPGLAVGQYPAKYSLLATTASCNDFVVFPTGASSSTTQATIVAFNNIYDSTNGINTGCNGTNQTPTTYWSYYTPPGGTTGEATTANLSPVLSWDGTQVAFIETYSSAAYLVILKMPAPGTTTAATYATPAYPGSGLTYKVAGSYLGCAAPCYTTIQLDTTGTETDTYSAPFYDYGAGGIAGGDTIYVGDDAGKLHQVLHVFGGSPALDTTTGWPVTATTETNKQLNSPVFDQVSGYLFVGDGSGYLHQIDESTRAVTVSGHLEYNTAGTGGIAEWDPPIVDDTSGTDNVLQFVGYSDDTTETGDSRPSYINLFTATGTNSIEGGSSYGTSVYFPNGSTSARPAGTSTVMRAGTFDDVYFASGGTAGNVYSCADGAVFQAPVTDMGAKDGTVNTFDTPASGGTALCSPVTEFAGSKANTTLNAAISSTTPPASTTVNQGGGITAPARTATTINEAGGITAASATVTVTSATGITANVSYIQIGTEDMFVTGVAGTTLTITRGSFGTIPAAHANTAAVTVLNTTTFTATSTANITVGDFIKDGTETMYVTTVASPNVTVVRAVEASTYGAHGNGTTVSILAPVTVVSNTGIENGDYVQVDSELMLVDGVAPSGTKLAVTQGQLSTMAATHLDGAAVQDVLDWIFLSVASESAEGACAVAHGCLLNYAVLNAGTTGTATAGLALPNADTTGTSGIVIDNLSTTEVGAQQIYYTTGGGDTAVQASQQNP